jgi:hypothetical protein
MTGCVGSNSGKEITPLTLGRDALKQFSNLQDGNRFLGSNIT